MNVCETISSIKRQLSEHCGTSGAPYGEYGRCVALLDGLKGRATKKEDVALQDIAKTEIAEAFALAAAEGRRFVVQFVRCSYLMQGSGLATALGDAPGPLPAILLGCAGGVLVAVCTVPVEMVTEHLTAERWLGCVAPVFQAGVKPATPLRDPRTYAVMTETKVSLINCEQLVQDAMRVAIKYAQAHTKDMPQPQRGLEGATKNRQHN